MAIDMRCHGDRSPGVDGICVDNRSAQEVADLLDVVPNNDNASLMGSDGIPDDSGIGWFDGDGVVLRDSQMAAVIELLHILRTLRTPNVFTNVNPNAGNVHVIAHGQLAPIAILAMAETQDPTARYTMVLPSAGGDYREMIMNGPAELKNGWIATLPHGLTEAESSAYFTFVEENLLGAVDLSIAAVNVRERLVNGSRFERVLLPHGRATTVVPEAARDAFVSDVMIPLNRISQHNGVCDDFFLFACNLGENLTWMAEARRQMVTFVDTGGVTVTPPGQ
jgi:hypothetical protein